MKKTIISHLTDDHVDNIKDTQSHNASSSNSPSQPSVIIFLQNFFSSLANTEAFTRLTKK